MSVRLVCPDCGHTTTSRTRPLAEYGQRRHSCDTVRERAARAQRRLDRAAASGPEAPCTHNDRHPHGSRTRYVIDRCRCRPCRDAHRSYENARARARLYGQHAYVDATPARVHVQSLQVWGMGWRRIAAAAGLAESTIWKLLYTTPPKRQIRASTRARILAVTLTVADHALVPATGTTRRLQALAAIGWPMATLAARAGVNRQRFDRAVHGDALHVTKATADLVRDLYGQLWNTRPTQGRAEATRRRAQRLRWAPPLAWDDETIDNPAARPEGLR